MYDPQFILDTIDDHPIPILLGFGLAMVLQNEATYDKQVFTSAQRFLDVEDEVGRVVSTPADFESRFLAPSGAFFHVDMLVNRVGKLRPAKGFGGYETPVEGLYLAGVAAHPSGGVTGWPGRLAAQHAMGREAAGA